MGHAVHGVGRRQKARGSQMRTIDRIIAEVIVEPRPPGRAQRIPWLQNTPHSGACATAHQPQMAPAFLRHQFNNDTGLAVALNAEHNGFIGPLHVDYVCATPRAVIPILSLRRKLQPHLAVTLRIVAPAFPHLDE